jgi:hypothetical protein
VLAAVILPAAGHAAALPGSDTTVVAVDLKGVPDGKSAASVAKCPAGARVEGGGVNTTGPEPLLAPLYIVQLSGPLNDSGQTANTRTGDVATAWYAAIKNVSGATQNFKVFAMCSRNSDATVAETTLSAVPTGAITHAIATCPAGTRAVGGGVNTTGQAPGDLNITGPGPDHVVNYSVELDGPLNDSGSTANTKTGDVATQWYAAILNDSGSTLDFKVFALCSRGSDATLALNYGIAPNLQADAHSVPCPSGKRALGGGVNTSTGPDPSPGSEYHVDLTGPLGPSGTTADTLTGDVARTWYAAITNNTGTQQTFREYVICASDATAGGTGGSGGGGGGGGTAGTPGGPTLSGAHMTNTSFAVDKHGPTETAVTAKATHRPPAPKGTTFIYTLNAPARMLFRIEQLFSGRQVGRSCQPLNSRNRHNGRCTRSVNVGAFVQDAQNGTNQKPWSGKIGRRTLGPGSYRATLQARDAAGRFSNGTRLGFAIVKS